MSSTNQPCEVSAICNQDGQLEVFGIFGGTVWHTWQTTPGGTWYGSWLQLYSDTDLIGGISVTSNKDGRLEVFGFASDNTIRHTWQTAPAPAGSWYGSWEELSGGANNWRGFSITSNLDGRIEIFGIGQDNTVWHAWQTTPGGSSYSSWEALYSHADQFSEISATSNYDGRLEVFGIAPDGSVRHTWETAPAGDWNGNWESLSDDSYEFTKLCVLQDLLDGKLTVFAITKYAAIWHTWQTSPGNDWHGSWSELYTDDDMLYQLSATCNLDGRLELFGVTSDLAVCHTWQTGLDIDWNGYWGSLSSPVYFNYPVSLSVVHNQDGRLEVFFGADNTVWHIWQTAPGNGWNGGSWTSLGQGG